MIFSHWIIMYIEKTIHSKFWTSAITEMNRYHQIPMPSKFFTQLFTCWDQNQRNFKLKKSKSDKAFWTSREEENNGEVKK